MRSTIKPAVFAAFAIMLGGLFASTQQPALAQWGPWGGSGGGGGGGNATTLDGVDSTGFCQVAGDALCTMTGGTLYSGVSSDLTTATNEDLTIAPSGTGSVLLQSGDNRTEFLDSGGGTDLTIETSTAVSGIGLLRTSASPTVGGAVRVSTNIVTVGAMNDVQASTVAGCFGDQLQTGSGTTLICAYGGGILVVDKQQSVTISTGTDTTVPTSSQVELTCTTGPCSYSPGETSIPDGAQIEVCNVDAADDITIAEAAGVVRTRGGAGFVLKSGGDCATCTYSGSIWGCH